MTTKGRTGTTSMMPVLSDREKSTVSIIAQTRRARHKPVHAQPEVNDLGAGNWQVQSKSTPALMHLVQLAANSCTCVAAVDWHKAECSHRQTAREHQQRKERAALMEGLLGLVRDHGMEAVSVALGELTGPGLPEAAVDWKRATRALTAEYDHPFTEVQS